MKLDLRALMVGFASVSLAQAAPAPSGEPISAKPGVSEAKANLTRGGAAESTAPPPVSGDVRWVAATPDAMVDFAAKRARSTQAPEAMAGLALLYSFAPRASAGLAHRHLLELVDTQHPIEAPRGSLAQSGGSQQEVAAQAQWLASMLEPVPARAAPDGLVTHWAVLGPFQDTGGGLKEAPFHEEDPAAWADRNASYSWGVYDVHWRDVMLPVTSRGVPLDVYIHPRKESCAYLASRITLAQAGPVVVHLASAGSVRVIWDGATVGQSEELHLDLVFDRFGARIEKANAGDHLLAVKVCSGAPDDSGRVRVRLATPDEHPAPFASSRDLSPLAKTPFAKPVVKPVQELLTKVLAGSAKATSTEPLLATAVVRTRGGADDLRSPRAPGLIDHVARDPKTSADALAMAGWISPFGAVRSGWLHTARDRALVTHDLPAADFAIRRLAAARAEAEFGDWALAALGSEPVVHDTDSEAHLLRAHVHALVGGEAAKHAALTELLQIVETEKARVSEAVWDEIARLAQGLDPKLELRARDELARRAPERYDAERVRAAQALDAEAVVSAAMAAVQLGGITKGDELEEVAQALLHAGRSKEAREYLHLFAQLAPNLPKVASAYAETLFLSQKSADQEQAAMFLRRAYDLEPSDARMRAEVALREKEKKSGPAPDERWLAPMEAFLARAKQNPVKKGEVADRQLFWMRAVTLHDDRRVSQLVHYSREIVIAPRTQEELYETIPLEGDETEILRARVHRANGDTSFAEEQKSEEGRPLIRWPDLKPGDVVEVAVRCWTLGPIGRRGDVPFYFMDYAGALTTHPLMYNEVVVDSPKQKPLAIDILHGTPDRVLRTEEGTRTVTRYIWNAPLHLAEEPLSPKPSEIFPTLVGSTFGSWADFRAWYRGAVEGFTEPDEQVRALAAELTKGKTRREDKLKAIFEYVADDIRYVNYVSGEWWLPNRPQQLLARRQGDCDDKAILLITLLKSIGIDATEVLVQTRYTGQPSVLLSKQAAVPLFDHGIAFLPGKNGEPPVWLDATSPQSRLGPVPSMDTRTYALFASEGPAQMVPTPVGIPDDYGFQSNWVISLSQDGSAELDAQERHRGDHAFLLRSNLREKDARAQWVEQNLVAAWIPQVEVDKEVDFTPDLPHGEATVRYHAKSHALGHAEGKDLVVTLAPSSTLTSQLAPLPTRTLPVVLPAHLAPSKQTHVVRLIAPEGMKPEALPPSGEESGGEFGRARLELALDPKNPRVVLLTRTVIFDQSVIPIEKYAAWRGWLARVDGLLHRSVRFQTLTP